MKHLSILLLVFFVMNSCIGQKTADNPLISTSPTVQLGGSSIYDTKIQTADTTKVLMLVCDTSNANYLKRDEETGRVTKVGGEIKWQFGYIVYDYKTNFWYESIYLDQNKKPLPKSIIVWISKEIKKP